MGKIINKNYKKHFVDPTRSILANSFNYEIGVMMQDNFLDSNKDIEDNILEESDVIQNGLNGKDFLDDNV